jgi:hypothetical protein
VEVEAVIVDLYIDIIQKVIIMIMINDSLSSARTKIDRYSLETGQGLTEYAFIFSFVVVLLVVLLYFFGNQVELTYRDILDALPF